MSDIYVVAIETVNGSPTQYLAPWDGDPGRTCILANAKRFSKRSNAYRALEKAETYRKLPTASVFLATGIES